MTLRLADDYAISAQTLVIVT